MTKIKICGVTTPEDAKFVARAGADYVGFILSKHVRRGVSKETARAIAAEVLVEGACPVAVFTEGSSEEIVDASNEIQVTTVQLHGAEPRMHYLKISQRLTSFFTVVVAENGSYDQNEIRKGHFLVADRGKGGEGKPFNWIQFKPPENVSWFLAGGITPENVLTALELKPFGLDVSSGVEKIGTTRKNRECVYRLIQMIRGHHGS